MSPNVYFLLIKLKNACTTKLMENKSISLNIYSEKAMDTIITLTLSVATLFLVGHPHSNAKTQYFRHSSSDNTTTTTPTTPTAPATTSTTVPAYSS